MRFSLKLKDAGDEETSSPRSGTDVAFAGGALEAPDRFGQDLLGSQSTT
jgi:hypothetical protein